MDRDSDEMVELQATDWFYMPRKVFNEPKFWEIMLAIGDRHESLGCLGVPEDLRDLLPHPQRPRCGSKGHRARVVRRFKLYFKYELARTRRDVDMLEKLASQVPGWRRPERLGARLKSKRDRESRP